MSLRGNRSGIFEPGSMAILRPWLAAAQETAVLLVLVAGVCLSWPQAARSMLLATKIAYYYCISLR